jgi:hypothetical protein
MRQITNDQEALEYIRCALKFSGIERFDAFEMPELPAILEKFDEEWELEQEDANYIIAMIVSNYDKMVAYCTAKMN